MCGIVGVIGGGDAVAVLVEGLARLEYRGYDSAGVAVVGPVGPEGPQAGRAGRRSGGGRCRSGSAGAVGIGHTRWATHGEPNDVNAHPQVDASGHVAVVHNGIVENAAELRAKLAAEGVDARVGHRHRGHRPAGRPAGRAGLPLEQAVREALSLVAGTYGLAVVDDRQPDRIVVARNGSPVVLGVGAPGTLRRVRRRRAGAPHRPDRPPRRPRAGGAARPASYRTFTLDARPTDKRPGDHRGGGHGLRPGRPRALHAQGDPRAAGRRRADAAGAARPPLRHRPPGRDQADGPGRAGRAAGQDPRAAGRPTTPGWAGALLIEGLSRIPADAEPASEFRYRNPVIDPETLYVAVSQSGETFDTLAAMQEVKRKGGDVIGVVNAPGQHDRRCVRRRACTSTPGPRCRSRRPRAFTSTAGGVRPAGPAPGPGAGPGPGRRGPADRGAGGAAGRRSREALTGEEAVGGGGPGPGGAGGQHVLRRAGSAATPWPWRGRRS